MADAPTPDPTPDPTPTPDPPETGSDTTPVVLAPGEVVFNSAALGDAGKQAIDRMKAERNAAKEEARAAKEALDALKAAQMTEQEKAIEAARQEAAAAARAEVTGTVNERLFKSEVKAAASAEFPTADGKHIRLADPSLLADPEVARRLLGFDEYPVTESGDIDAEAISAAVAAFVAERPNLTASATPPAGSADQGTRTPPAPKDLATAIAEAEQAGDWTTAQRLKVQQLAALPRP